MMASTVRKFNEDGNLAMDACATTLFTAKVCLKGLSDDSESQTVFRMWRGLLMREGCVSFPGAGFCYTSTESGLDYS